MPVLRGSIQVHEEGFGFVRGQCCRVLAALGAALRASVCLFSAVFALLCMPAAAKPAVPDVLVVPGDLPVVLTALHAGRVTHGRKDKRVCLPEHDLVCESGPCRTFGDRFLDVLAPAFQAQLGACLGGKPWFILMNVDRAFIDASRSVDDPGGPTCALAAPSDRQAYDQFFAAVDESQMRGGEGGITPCSSISTPIATPPTHQHHR